MPDGVDLVLITVGMDASLVLAMALLWLQSLLLPLLRPQHLSWRAFHPVQQQLQSRLHRRLRATPPASQL